MARDRHEDLNDADADADAVPPRTLRQPADVAPIGHVGDVPALPHSVPSGRTAALGQPRRSVLPARLGGPGVGRTDRHLLFALARATDALATHCDVLSDRFSNQAAITADLGDTLGSDVTQLRAEVIRLRRLVAEEAQPADG